MWRKLIVAGVVVVLLVAAVRLFVWRRARLGVMLSLPAQGRL